MGSCTACGHRLGVGRFCANCGAAVDPSGARAAHPPGHPDWRTDTAERPVPPVSTDPRTPPSAVPPAPPRYPLYADEVDGWSPDGALITRTGADPEPAPAAPVAEPEPALAAWYDAPAEAYDYPAPAGAHEAHEAHEAYGEYEHDEERRSPWLWVLATIVVVALVAAAWWFLVRDPDSGTDGTASAEPSAGASSAGAGGTDVAPRAEVQAPRSAPPNQDVTGAQVSYDASNMNDGKPDTTWRVAGDATGTAIKISLAAPTTLTSVGLINGYAKTSTDDQGRTFDWYAGNRRITEVVWVFPGGVTVRQPLTDDRELQSIDVDPITVSKVVLRIASVSPPGDGTASRNFTAISELSLVGSPS